MSETLNNFGHSREPLASPSGRMPIGRGNALTAVIEPRGARSATLDCDIRWRG
jgi:hypothetical protein